jgi:protein SCO1/2
MRRPGRRPFQGARRLAAAALLTALAHPAAAGSRVGRPPIASPRLVPRPSTARVKAASRGARASGDGARATPARSFGVRPAAAGWARADGRGTSLGEAMGGRPTLLMPLDYACRNVCDPMLAGARASGDGARATPARSFGVRPAAAGWARAVRRAPPC